MILCPIKIWVCTKPVDHCPIPSESSYGLYLYFGFQDDEALVGKLTYIITNVWWPILSQSTQHWGMIDWPRDPRTGGERCSL